MDDIIAAHQLVNGHMPMVAENLGFAAGGMSSRTTPSSTSEQGRYLLKQSTIFSRSTPSACRNCDRVSRCQGNRFAAR
ncbi:MAG: hypothetical protein EOR84_34270 [Mesorhizobium sp.]|uniref:hypothetical protein n=1 Tax=Mesorhizobium sp. TaxID=1871066 RepID=UPI000FEAA5FA|nr:hypothetical protein [Mesorhizobium sp.]RWM82848.1 MAG: hypothetical protein EOR84_34270 [Mesorhizobium sp.]